MRSITSMLMLSVSLISSRLNSPTKSIYFVSTAQLFDLQANLGTHILAESLADFSFGKTNNGVVGTARQLLR